MTSRINRFSHISKQIQAHRFLILVSSMVCLGMLTDGLLVMQQAKTKRALLYTTAQVQVAKTSLGSLSTQLTQTQMQLSQVNDELSSLQNQDQVKKNLELITELHSIHDQFSKSVVEYEDILRLKEFGVKTSALDALFAQSLTLLSQYNYASASSVLLKLAAGISQQQSTLATISATIPPNIQQNNSPPASGYRSQVVSSDVGSFVVNIIAADLNSTRVQVETASQSDCGNNCPVDTLADFVAHSNGYAGVNGPYFCPAEYPSCAGKTNSFDTLMMNKSKVYFNSSNNVYSIVPLVVFSGTSARFIAHSQDWGRDTGVDAVIAGQPLLLSNGNIAFGGDGDAKKNNRTIRAFIGNKDSTVYIGSVSGASVVEVAHVLKALGLQNAINLDGAGSMALYANGHYVNGPGRNTPFGIVLVRK